MVFDIFLTVFLVLLNGFFVAAEFAIVKVRLSQIQVRMGQTFTARLAEGIVSHLDAYLAATQLGITLASLGLGWIGEPIVSKLITNFMGLFNLELDEETTHAIALPIAFAIITILHIVFGELAPKSLAIRHPINTTLAVAAPLKFFHVIFHPFIWMLNGFANFILKLIGIQPVPHAGIHSEEELKLIIAESAEGGAIEPSERELIQNVFDFDDRFVWQVLRPRTQIAAIEADTELEEAIEYALQEGYSRFPVYEDSIDKIIGFVHSKDLLLLSRSKNGKPLRDILRPVL
ncbi:MAG: hemolysin family protein, partial [Bacteroidota bacterium]